MTISDQLRWSHYYELLKCTHEMEISFYQQTIPEHHSYRIVLTSPGYRLTYTDRDHPDRAPVPKMNSMFQFTKALSRRSRMMLNFDYTRACQVNDPFASG